MKKLYFIVLMAVMFHAGIFDQARAEVAPYQIAIINPIQIVNERDSIKGFRFNFGLGVNNDVFGLDMGCINVADGEQRGLQFGLFNKSFKSTGVQIGLVNKTEYLKGIQIGLLNIHAEGETFRVLPGVNFSF